MLKQLSFKNWQGKGYFIKIDTVYITGDIA
jgi:hypothetical protein